MLHTAGLPHIMSLVAPRKLLYRGVRNGKAPDAHRPRFERILAEASPGSGQRAWYDPDRPLDARLLLDWLEANN